MCGRFQQSSDLAVLERRFDFSGSGLDYHARYNLAPGQEALVVLAGQEARQGRRGRRGAMLRWGLVPHWVKEEKTGYKMINARAETVAEKPAFRGPMRRSRCLVLADGFYEWGKSGGHKQPYRLSMQGDAPFAMAGLWDAWRPPDGGELLSFTIVTTGANSLVEPIHDRMPAILAPVDEDAWLRGPEPEALELLKPLPADMMRARAISSRVNSPANDDPAIIEPMAVQDDLFGVGNGEPK